MAALSCLCQSFKELCQLQLLHQQGGVRVKAASAESKVPIPTHYHLQEKNTWDWLQFFSSDGKTEFLLRSKGLK